MVNHINGINKAIKLKSINVMQGRIVNYNLEKVDEMTLALLYLVIYEENIGYLAWKGFEGIFQANNR